LNRLPPGWRLELFDTIDSTNAEASRRARDNEDAGLVVVSSSQTAGRGRSGRSWSTAGSDLAMSMLLRPGMPPAEAAKVAFVAALAVYDFASRFLPIAEQLAIKWPNDVMIGSSKLSGILAEASGSHSGNVEWLVVGIGVNLRPAERPEATNPIDLFTVSGIELAVEDAARGLLQEFDNWYRLWLSQGFAPIRDAWRARTRDLGRLVMARLPNETIVGEARDLAEDGALILTLRGGGERRISAGDIFPFEPEQKLSCC
jgi:BirA family biotin operon repressor/biotin-[acetyl-CoA-carboxylase] ligase